MHVSFDHIVSFTLAALLHLLALLFAGRHLARVPEEASVPELEVTSVELTLEGDARETAASSASDSARRRAALVDDPEAVPPLAVPEAAAEQLPLPPALPIPKPIAARPEAQPLAEPAHAPLAELPNMVPDVSGLSDRPDTSAASDSPGATATLEAGGSASGHIDAHPSLARPIRPNYPIGARRRGEEGTVILDVTVAADGRAERITLVSSSGFPELDRAAERAAEQARFKPATRGRQPFASAARLTLIFRLRDP